MNTRDTYLHHFKTVDPLLEPYVASLPEEKFPQKSQFSSEKLFQRLAEDVIGQQLSGKVARVITGRFHELFASDTISPEDVLSIDQELLRGVGMSWSKVRTIRDLAEKSPSIPWENLDTLSNEEVMAHLLPVWGIGDWTAEMFLLFTLGREDVFSPKDLGLKKGIQLVYSLDEIPSPQEAEEMAKKWAPYRSIASLALWWSLDNPGRREE